MFISKIAYIPNSKVVNNKGPKSFVFWPLLDFVRVHLEGFFFFQGSFHSMRLRLANQGNIIQTKLEERLRR